MITLEQIKTLINGFTQRTNDVARMIVNPDWNENDESSRAYIRNRPFYRHKGKVKQIDSAFIPEKFNNTVEMFDFDKYVTNGARELQAATLDPKWKDDFSTLINKGVGIMICGTVRNDNHGSSNVKTKQTGFITRLDGIYSYTRGRYEVFAVMGVLGYYNIHVGSTKVSLNINDVYNYHVTNDQGAFIAVDSSGLNAEFLADNAKRGQFMRVLYATNGHPTKFEPIDAESVVAPLCKINYNKNNSYTTYIDFFNDYGDDKVLHGVRFYRVGDAFDGSSVLLPMYTIERANGDVETKRFVLGQTLIKDADGWYSDEAKASDGMPLFFVNQNSRSVQWTGNDGTTYSSWLSSGAWVGVPTPNPSTTPVATFADEFIAIYSANESAIIKIVNDAPRWVLQTAVFDLKEFGIDIKQMLDNKRTSYIVADTKLVDAVGNAIEAGITPILHVADLHDFYVSSFWHGSDGKISMIGVGTTIQLGFDFYEIAMSFYAWRVPVGGLQTSTDVWLAFHPVERSITACSICGATLNEDQTCPECDKVEE